MTSNYTCRECSSEQKSHFLINFFIIISLTLLFIVAQQKAIYTRFQKERLGYYLRMLKLAPISKSCLYGSTSYKVKQIIYFFQIFSAINQIDLILPGSYNYFYLVFGQQPKSVLDSLQCVQLELANFSGQFQKIINLSSVSLMDTQLIISVFFPFAYFIISLVVGSIYIGQRPYVSLHTRIIGIFEIINFFLVPNLIAYLSSALTCTKIGNKHYINSDLKYECLQESNLPFSLVFYIPGIIFWLFISIISLCKIYSIKHQLHTLSSLYKYGYIYSEYKDTYFYWEFIRIVIRTLIAVGSTSNGISYFIMLSASVLILISYLICASICSPHKYSRIWKLDVLTNISILLVILINMHYTTVSPNFNYSSGQKWTYQILVSIIFFSQLSFFIFSVVKQQFSNLIIPKLILLSQEKIPFLRHFISVKYLNKKSTIPILKRWKFLANSINRLLTSKQTKPIREKRKQIKWEGLNVQKQTSLPIQDNTMQSKNASDQIIENNSPINRNSYLGSNSTRFGFSSIDLLQVNSFDQDKNFAVDLKDSVGYNSRRSEFMEPIIVPPTKQLHQMINLNRKVIQIDLKQSSKEL